MSEVKINADLLIQLLSAATAAPDTPAATVAGAERAVLVTTAHGGVFFGYATETNGSTIKLRQARNCVYWPVENKGFLGLASDGPAKGARVGPAADIELRDVTCVAAVTDAAVKAWEAAPWKS